MIEKIFLSIYKLKKDPCKTCLVKTMCDYRRRCEKYIKYHIVKKKGCDVCCSIELTFIVSLFVLTCAWVIFTFFCGIYQQYLYIKALF